MWVVASNTLGILAVNIEKEQSMDRAKELTIGNYCKDDNHTSLMKIFDLALQSKPV